MRPTPLLPITLRVFPIFAAIACVAALRAQPATTVGFLNQARTEAPGTLLSHPLNNDSEAIGRTTSLNYLNGWLIVGGEVPGSRPGSDLLVRVYDVANPAAPVRRLPSDFGLAYTGNRWVQDNYGFNAHGTVKIGNYLAPVVLEVASFGAPVRLGGQHGIPDLGQIGIGYNRSSQAGPWTATFPWYGSPDQDFTIQRVTNTSGWNQFQTVATFDHVGPYGGGDWHPMFFGDLLIYARSGGSARDGVVVYRLEYNNYDDPAARSITPHFVGSLPGGFQGYWPVLFSDGDGLYVVGSSTNILLAANITQTAHPSGDGSVHLAASLNIPNFSNASYPVFQDNFAFIHNRKIDMTRFVAGDADPIVLTLNEATPPVPAGAPAAPSGVNTSQMSLALGNLWVTGGYPLNYGTANYMAQGMAVWVHQQAPDTTRPRVVYHIPQTGRTNYPRHAPLSFLIPEHSRRGGPRLGADILIRPVTPGVGGAPDVLGAPVTGMAAFDFSGVLTVTPDPALAADTTYQVDFVADDRGTPLDLNDDHGFQDASGNLIEPYSFRFSTGGGISAVPPPAISSVTASLYQTEPGQQTTITASATGADLEYRFNFEGVWTEWSAIPSASFAYTDPGRPRVLVQVRGASGQITNGSVKLLVVPAPAAGPSPTQSSTLAIGDDPSGRRVWVVNPDAHTVAVLDAATGAKIAEHATGANSNPRSIARDALGRYWVTCHMSDEVRVFNADGTVAHALALPYGSAPFGVAASPDGQSLFVTLHGSGRLLRYAASAPLAAPTTLDLFPTARAIAVSANGQRVLVTRFISPELEAEVADVAFTTSPSPSLTLTRTIRLSSANVTDGGDRASGVPNYLAAIAISPDGSRAAVASKQDNIQRGILFGVGDLTHETAVRAVVSFIDLTVSNAEIRDSRRDFDNSADPSALAYTPLGDTLLVALQGSNTVVGLDALNLTPVAGHNTAGSTETSPAVLAFELSAGLAPQGILLDPTSNRLFTQNFTARTVTVRNAAPLLVENRTVLPPLPASPVATVATELLAPDVLLGKQIFYNAADPRMSADGYIACATCHADGGHDGRAWDFTGRGEGLRRTTDLRGRSGLGHGRVHWSGNFDEIQDFEHDIRGPFGGTGFIPLSASRFAALHPSPASGKTGLSPELDALAAYVTSLTPASTPRSPHRNPDGTLSAAALRGRDVFNAQSCADCHVAPRLTDSAAGSVSTPNLHDVGTLSALSGLRLHGPLEGIDTPTLHGLHATRSYLHHGEAATLASVFSYAGGTLRLASAAELVGLSPAAIATDSPAQGGGGFYRGAIGGSSVSLEGASTNAVRFSALDGGATGGSARLAIRYVRQYGGSTAALVVNGGAPQNLTLERQYPDNGWQISGWRWLVLDVALQPGANNVIELRRGSGDWHLNAILLANADDLAAAHPHRRVLDLAEGSRSDLLAYLRTLDGRDDAGIPLTAPAPPAPVAPAILVPPAPLVVAVGNLVSLHVAVSGTGPFTYQWRRGQTLVGVNSPVLEIPAAALSDAGDYSVRITNSAGEIVSAPIALSVNPALAVSTTALPRATVGRPYDFALAAIGGIDARGWSLASGPLPAGLVLTAEGRIQGTPTAPARAMLAVRVADSSGFAARALALDVRPQGGFSSDPDLVLHYTFDEGSGSRVWDSATAGNDHSTDVPNIPAGFPINGTASWTPSGRFGGAYGNASLSQGLAPFFPANQTDLDFDPRAQAFTISVWVRTTTTGGYRTILSKNGFADENWRVQYRLWTTNPATNLQGVSGDGWSGQFATAPALNDGQWHLVTLVNYLDGAVWRSRLYYDGGANFTQWNTGAGGRTPRLLAIGDTSNGYNGWNGQIDDLRIYRRALSPAEITALYAPAAAANYDAWIAGLANPPAPEHRAPAAIPPGAAHPNLLAYALAFDPFAPGASAGVPPIVVNPSRRLSLSFTRHRPDLDYVVESSTDLAAWTPIATNPVPVGQPAVVEDPTPLSAESPRRFLRLRVEER